MTDLLALCDRLVAMVGARGEAIATASAATDALTRFANSAIHQNVAEDAMTVRLQVVVDGRPAAATTDRTDDQGLTDLVDRALAAAAVRPVDDGWPGAAPAAPLLGADRWDDATALASPADRAARVRAFVDAGAGLEGAGFCSTVGATAAVASSAGQRVQSRYTAATVDGIFRTGTSDGVGRASAPAIAAVDGAAAGQRAADRARRGAEATDIDPGDYEVVLEPSCVAEMLDFLAWHGWNAKAHADGLSFVHLGDQQLDPSLDIWDDATDPRTIGPRFDADGTPKGRLDLVRGGISAGLAHDRRTAHQAGVESTGHGIGSASFGAVPTNLFLGAGTASPEELVSDVERGLLVSDFWYTRILDPKTQVVTGLTRNGVFLIEHGEITRPVRNMRFTQSYVSALAPGHVLSIGRDAQLIGSSHIPTLRLASWRFTGGAKG